MPPKNQVPIKCAVCGKVFDVKASHASRRKTCSKKCYGVHMSHKQSGENAPGWKGGLIERPCVICGKMTARRRSHAAMYRAICSPKCRGELLRLTNSGPDNGMYKGLRAVQCANCAAPIERYPCHADTQEHFFCNLRCMGEWRAKTGVTSGEKNGHWRGGWQSYYGPNWESQRRRARMRDNYTCRCCQRKHKDGDKQFDVHHVRPFREFGYVPGENDNYKQANKLANLITLCPSCHKKAEHGKVSFQLNLI